MEGMGERLEVDQETIAKTECDKGYVCLGGDPLYCSVMSTLGHNMLLLVCRFSINCRHNRSYGSLQACNCPVRHEIFTKYGK